jgi:hypothetical protein
VRQPDQVTFVFGEPRKTMDLNAGVVWSNPEKACGEKKQSIHYALQNTAIVYSNS